MIETVAVSDVFVTRLAKMEWVSSSCMRFYFCADQGEETILVAKLVVPIDCIREISATRLRMMRNLGAAEGVVVAGGRAHSAAS
jgi:hypothetical protein